MPVSPSYVSGQLHGGPHDGEIVPMPWARTEIPVLSWVGEEPVVSTYLLARPWRGQDTAYYEWARPILAAVPTVEEPEEPVLTYLVPAVIVSALLLAAFTYALIRMLRPHAAS